MIRGVSDEGENLEDLLPSMEKKFSAIGLTLKKDNDTFKSTYEIMKDLAGVWEDLTDMQRADILFDNDNNIIYHFGLYDRNIISKPL